MIASRLRRFGLLAAFLLAVGVAPARAEPAGSGGVLLAGTPHATRWYVADSGKPGPTVVITSGLHGDEVAGAYAADQVRRWPIVKGKLFVLPRANVAALAARKRYTPSAPKALRNLNRNFPRAGKDEGPRGDVATAIWEWVKTRKPDWALDLHEGFDFNRINSKSVGSTVIVHREDEARAVAARITAAVNATITDERKRFHVIGPPVDGSISRAVVEHLGAAAMILETTKKKQAVSRRARQHRIMVHALLLQLGMIPRTLDPDQVTDRVRDAGRIHVAVYDAGGTGGAGVPRCLSLLGEAQDARAVRIGPDEIRGGELSQFDVVIFSGGTGSGQARNIGDEGRDRVRRFVQRGGGFVGICAGAYLATERFSWGLRILDAKTVSPKWRRGSGNVLMELTDAGKQILGRHDGPIPVRYANGPILERAKSPALPDFETLAYYRSELAKNGTPKGIMVNSPAIVGGRCGAGRIVVFGPHPEQTEGLGSFVTRAVRWTAQRPALAAADGE